MTGIYGVVFQNRLAKSINLRSYLDDATQENRVSDYVNYPNAILGRCSLSKFVDDRLFQKTSGRLVCNDGVILNLRPLLSEKRTGNLSDLILKLYNEQKNEFPKEFRGSFAGFIYSENGNNLLLFVDHISSRPLFYFHVKGEMLIFGTQLNAVTRLMREMGYETCLDENGAYSLLSYGTMLGDLTLVKGVKRLPAGGALSLDDGEISVRRYYRLSNQPPAEGTEREILGELNKRFRKAVFAEYAKDEEYGYKHISTLSGGLDTRTNVAYATKLGFEGLTCLTFSLPNYLDHKIARKICRDNGFENKFFSLDWGNHQIQYMDKVINITGGLVSFAGPCNFYPWLARLQLERFGLLHTGIMGGETLGEYLTQKLSSLAIGGIAGNLLTRISALVDKEVSKYEDEDLFKLALGFNQHSLTMHMASQFIDTISAHTFVDLMNYSIRIPPEYRANKKVYAELVSVYLPQFAKYTWEHYRVPPRYPLHLLRGYDRVLSMFKQVLSRLSPYYSMYPFNFWYRKNDRLRNGFETIVKTDIRKLENHHRLEDDCMNEFEQGMYAEKAAVITLLRAMKILGLD